MSNAIQCDRCGKFSPIYRRSDISNYSSILTIRAKDCDNGWTHDLDLCPDCYKEFEHFMKRGKEIEDETDQI